MNNRETNYNSISAVIYVQEFQCCCSAGVYPIRVKLSDLVGWHGQTLFVRAFLATHNGKKSTGNVAGNCPPLAGDQGGGKGTRKQCGKNQKPMKPIITLTTNGCDRLQTTCVRK